MKKYILSTVIVSMLGMANIVVAMEKEKKEIKTSLSSKKQAKLREAVKDYKANKSRAKQEKLINKYKNKYPNDPFVKAKVNEKARFDSSMKSSAKKESAKPQVKKPESVVNQPVSQQSRPEKKLSTNGKQQVDETPNMRIANKSSQVIIIGIDKLYSRVPTEEKIIGPHQTISFYTAYANKDISDQAFSIDVHELKGYKFVPLYSYNPKDLKIGYGLSSLEPISKGQIIDLEYKDDHTYFPLTYDKMEQTYFGHNESKRHLYQVRDGKKVERNTEK